MEMFSNNTIAQKTIIFEASGMQQQTFYFKNLNGVRVDQAGPGPEHTLSDELFLSNTKRNECTCFL